MTRTQVAPLPGVGHLHVLTTTAGRYVGVVRHRGGRRELVIYRDDHQTVGTSLLLTRDEAEGLADMLGAKTTVARHIARLDHHAHGLVTLQLLLGADSPGHTVDAVRRRSTADAALLAVVRDGELLPNPPPAFRLLPGHVVVVVGPLAAALDMLEVIGRP